MGNALAILGSIGSPAGGSRDAGPLGPRPVTARGRPRRGRGHPASCRGPAGRVRLGLAAVGAAAVLAAGCGGVADDADVITTDAVSAALAGTVEAPVHRVTASATETLTMPGLDDDAGFEPPDMAPTIVATVADDRQHFLVTVAAAPGFRTADGGDPYEFEIWSDSERMVMDTRDYRRLADIAPGVDLGPMAPGLFFIDLAALGATHPELVDALVGVSPPSLRELAENLPAALDTIEQISQDPPIYVGSISVESLYQAEGVDLVNTVRSTVAGMSLGLGLDIDEMTEMLTEVYRAAEAEVVIEIDDQGLLSVLETRQDLSGVIRATVEAEGQAPGMTDQDRLEMDAATEGAEFIVETRAVYETGADIEVPPPPEATEDRTDEWRRFLTLAGFTR